MKNADKGLRASYKNGSYVSTIYDYSYVEAMEFICPSFHNLQSFFSLFNPIDKLAPSSITNKEFSINLYLPSSFPFHFLSKISYFWIQKANQPHPSLLCWFHPSVFDLFFDLFQKTLQSSLPVSSLSASPSPSPSPSPLPSPSPSPSPSPLPSPSPSPLPSPSPSSSSSSILILSRKGEFNRFKIQGPKSNLILHTVLRLYVSSSTSEGGSSNTKETVDIWDKLKLLSSSKQLPPSSILSLFVQHPSLHFPPTSVNVLQSTFNAKRRGKG